LHPQPTLMNAFYIFKIVHIIGFTAWFAGLFYLVRMFVYHTEAYDEDQPKQDILKAQFNIMEWRVYKIICNPAMTITWIFGIGMIAVMVQDTGWDWLKANYWLHFKLLLVFLLSGYQGYCKSLIKKLEKGKTGFSSTQFRLFNEVPTLFLILIASIAVYKTATNPLILILSIIGVMGVLVFFTKLYKKIRESKK
jgi:putative membrane protein